MQHLRWVLVIGCWSLSLSAIAAKRHSAVVSHTATLHETTAPPSTLTLSFAGRFFNYREVVNGQTFDSESGFLPGVELALDKPLGARGFVFNVDAVGLFGNSTYDGGTWGGQRFTATDHNVIFDLSPTVGYDLTRERSHHWIPYVGFGGHFWARDTGANMAGAYDERYWFLYVPIGIRYKHDLSRRVSIAADVSGRWNLGGWIKALNFHNGAYADSGTLGMALGTRAQVPVTVHVQRGFNLTFIPYFEYFGIGKGGRINIYNANGTLATVGQEPDSHSFLYGFNAATQISF